MERRKRRWVDEDPMARRLREMPNADLLQFFIELTSIFPRSRYRKSDIHLAQKEITRRMRRVCIIGAGKAGKPVAISYR